jgi:hypothetical protein
MLMNAVILAGLSAAGLIFVFKKLPPQVQEFLLKHAILTEILTFLATYATLGGTLTALFAGSIVGTVTTVLLHVRVNGHKDEYKGWIAAGRWIHSRLAGVFTQVGAFLYEKCHLELEPTKQMKVVA